MYLTDNQATELRQADAGGLISNSRIGASLAQKGLAWRWGGLTEDHGKTTYYLTSGGMAKRAWLRAVDGLERGDELSERILESRTRPRIRLTATHVLVSVLACVRPGTWLARVMHQELSYRG